MEIDDGNTEISHVFEMRIGMNEFDHRILALLRIAQLVEHCTGIAEVSRGFESPFRSEFFRPFSLLPMIKLSVCFKTEN